MSNHRMRVFSTTFKEGVVRRLESGEALARVSKEPGIARKLLYEWRWAWRREGAAGLNRERGRKPLARYGAMGSALRERLAPEVLHHQLGHDRGGFALRLCRLLAPPPRTTGIHRSGRAGPSPQRPLQRCCDHRLNGQVGRIPVIGAVDRNARFRTRRGGRAGGRTLKNPCCNRIEMSRLAAK